MISKVLFYKVTLGKLRWCILCLPLLFLFKLTNAQEKDTLNTTLLKVFQTVKSNSLYSKKVDWNKLEQSIFNKTDAPLGFSEFKNKVKLLFSSIGDRHASLSIKGQTIRGFELHQLRPSLLKELKTSPTSLRTQMIDSNYGYILIPGNSLKDDVKKLSQAIQDSLCKLINKPLNGLIIDLRAHEGGSILPPFTGLHQVIGNGNFGAFGSLDGKTKVTWKLKDGKLYLQQKFVGAVKSNCKCSKNLKVAILLSQLTASAGEQLAIALRGRPNTIFIGEKTYGLTTGNVAFSIDGHLLVLSASLSEDRTGKIYIGTFDPDIELIEGDNFKNLNQDAKVIEALKWFKAN